MQELTQPEINRLHAILAYAKKNVKYPSQTYSPDVDFHYPSSDQIISAAAKRAATVKEYENFLNDIEKYLEVFKAIDYSPPLEATITVPERNTANLKELLTSPEKYQHLGTRKE